MSDDLRSWVDGQLAAHGSRRTGDLVLHRERTWATVHRARTDHGEVWLKTMPPDTAFEAGLYAVLTRVVPDHVLVPLGVDVERGWLLMPDAGPSFGEQYADLDGPMQTALRTYGEVQQRLAPHVGEMVAVGVTDMRPPVMAQRFDEAVDFARTYAAGNDTTRLAALRTPFADWCAELAESEYAASIDHNDLHARNVVGSPAVPVFYDWGDAVLAHPFAVLLTPLDTLPAELCIGVRDGYLSAYGDPVELRDEAELACRVALVARAHVWLRALGDRPAEHEHAHAPYAHLLRLLDGTANG